ncbi:methionyl-tRNA formyltransferase [Aeromonas jandaei]|uniref:methionyl-tRNA formyltransferase n=1 Tax=Aeromonas jandaei TaxID=650 RepID=UPI0038B49847
MKILLITQGLSRIVKPLFSSKYDVVGVLESMPRNFTLKAPSNKLYELVKNSYFFLKGQPTNLKKFCEKRRTPYNYITKGRDIEIEQWVKDLQPDLIVVFSMSQLLRREIFTIPPHGAINMHPSYLPDYRGPNPDFWQYYYMEMNPGVTIHYIDEGEDTGDIIFKKREYIALGTKSPERLDKLIGEVGVSLMLKAIEAIEDGTVTRTKQPVESSSCRARNLTIEEHSTIIDWENWPIKRIWHILRGTELWLNAYEQPKGFFKGQRWQVGHFVVQPNNYKPGSLVKYKGQNAIAIPDGFIYLSIRFNLKKVLLLLTT